MECPIPQRSQQVYIGKDLSTFTVSAARNASLTQHDDVCAAHEPTPGQCPRFVIESVGELLVGKLVFTAFVSPVLTVILSLPWVVAAMNWAKRKLGHKGYTRTLSLDHEVVMVSMLLDEVLVLGIAVPLILPLAGLAIGGRLAAVYLVTSKLGVQFQHFENVQPQWCYLCASLLIGALLLLWFFASNEGHICGVLVVYAGLPIGLAVGAGSGWSWQQQCRRGIGGLLELTPALSQGEDAMQRRKIELIKIQQTAYACY